MKLLRPKPKRSQDPIEHLDFELPCIIKTEKTFTCDKSAQFIAYTTPCCKHTQHDLVCPYHAEAIAQTIARERLPCTYRGQRWICRCDACGHICANPLVTFEPFIHTP